MSAPGSLHFHVGNFIQELDILFHGRLLSVFQIAWTEVSLGGFQCNSWAWEKYCWTINYAWERDKSTIPSVQEGNKYPTSVYDMKKESMDEYYKSLIV